MSTRSFIVCCLVLPGLSHLAWSQQNQLPSQSKPGRYIHALYGGARGLYVPDYSGKYRHVPVPYAGGYGDRGVPYTTTTTTTTTTTHNVPAGIDQAELQANVESSDGFMLGPRDHLRFMIDFNHNGTGWQIVQFEWLRDTDAAEQHVKYSNKLWQTEADSANYLSNDDDNGSGSGSGSGEGSDNDSMPGSGSDSGFGNDSVPVGGSSSNSVTSSDSDGAQSDHDSSNSVTSSGSDGAQSDLDSSNSVTSSDSDGAQSDLDSSNNADIQQLAYNYEPAISNTQHTHEVRAAIRQILDYILKTFH